MSDDDDFVQPVSRTSKRSLEISQQASSDGFSDSDDEILDEDVEGEVVSRELAPSNAKKSKKTWAAKGSLHWKPVLIEVPEQKTREFRLAEGYTNYKYKSKAAGSNEFSIVYE